MERFPTPSSKYDEENEAAFRRAVAEAIRNEFVEIRIGGGVLYVVNGALKYRSPAGTVTTVAPA